ncbi:MAG: ABC transporter permease [Coriobacteriia bacterium]|nr:ABC transporter permease [Coriobacteriia bacterium]
MIAARFRPDVAQVVVIAFLAVMIGAAIALGLPVAGLLGDTLLRVAMNGVLVLSLVPMLRAGLGMNYGMPLSVLPGLLGMVVALEMRLTGPLGLAAALALAVLFAIPVGAAYGALLRGVRGNEEVVGTFSGFSAVYLGAIFWGVAPFTNPKMLWPIGGQGLRPQTNLAQWFGHVLDRLGEFAVLGVRVPTGTLLAVGLVAALVALGCRSRWGVVTAVAADNPVFARAAGVPLGRLQIAAAVLSTVIAAVGITLYAHTYGFLQLYSAPLMLAFPAAASILIGGSGADGRFNVSSALLGTLLFSTILVFSTPLANALLVPELSDVVRVLITNGVLLYAMIRGSRSARAKAAR